MCMIVMMRVCVCVSAAGCGAAQASSVSSVECHHVDSALLWHRVSHRLPLLHSLLQKQQVDCSTSVTQ